MKTGNLLLAALALGTAVLTTGCMPAKGYDYSALRQSRPKSIVILPPVNDSKEIIASDSVLSVLTLPLAESGYYVLPVAVVHETFRQNGFNNPAETSGVPIAKLRQIFGADAGLYVHIKQYGTNYIVIASSSVVTAEARLVDLRTGALLWQGTATASSEETNSRASGGGLIGMLISAVINQIVEQSTDASHKVAGLTGARLLSAGQPAGLLPGPRSPKYEAR